MPGSKELIGIDLSIFEDNDKKEFVQIVRENKVKTTRALNHLLTGIKNEAADTKETSRIIYKYISNQKITKNDERHVKTQVYNIFRILGIGVPFMVIPGATLLIPFIVKVAEKKGIDLLPSNFKGKK